MNSMTTSQNGIDVLKHFEGLRLTAYQDSVGVWTIGYGTTKGVYEGMTITEQQAEQMMAQDLDSFERNVSNVVKNDIAQNQFDAMVVFSYNVGSGNLNSSTMLKLVNAGSLDQVPAQFLRWNKAGGQVLNGLTLRRKSEAHLFATGEVSFDFSQDATVDDYSGASATDLPPNYGA